MDKNISEGDFVKIEFRTSVDENRVEKGLVMSNTKLYFDVDGGEARPIFRVNKETRDVELKSQNVPVETSFGESAEIVEIR